MTGSLTPKVGRFPTNFSDRGIVSKQLVSLIRFPIDTSLGDGQSCIASLTAPNPSAGQPNELLAAARAVFAGGAAVRSAVVELLTDEWIRTPTALAAAPDEGALLEVAARAGLSDSLVGEICDAAVPERGLCAAVDGRARFRLTGTARLSGARSSCA
jgi:hypothetical protein